MFNFEDPSDLDTDWYLGDKIKSSEHIPKELLQKMSNFHLIGIQFLHENFIRKRQGVILNEDEDMNMALQVCTFLRAFRDRITIQSPVIVICPENSLCIWHYHFSEVGLDPQIITSEDIVYDVTQIFLLSFESLKLFDKLKHLNFFCAVIDDLDIIANKIFIRKVTGSNRIGLTKRNFYTNPDQKLRWTMLNWASPGCVGKLKDFYHIDHLHSLAFADNYRFWWMRLTFKFCASFEQPNPDEVQDYQEKLIQWGTKCGIPTNFDRSKPRRKTRKNGEKLKPGKPTIKPPGTFRVRRNRKFTNKNFGSKDSSSSNEDNEPEIKKTKSEVTRTTLNHAAILLKESRKNSEIIEINTLVSDGLVNGADKAEIKKEGITEITTNTEVTQNDVTSISEENLNERDKVEEASYASDSSDFFRSPKRERTNQVTDDEDPILSFISSKEIESVEEKKDLVGEVKTILQSSDTDSDFFADLVKNKDTAERFYTSQKISHVLDNLSDEELMKCEKNSEDDDFFSELILGKK